MSPDTGVSYLLPRVVGYSRAVDMIFTSRTVNAKEAHRMGLIDRLVPDNRLSTSPWRSPERSRSGRPWRSGAPSA